MHISLLTTSIAVLRLAQASSEGLHVEEALIKQTPELQDEASATKNTSHNGTIAESDFWSEPVKCIPKETSDEEYCVYTHTLFASNRGISFFTTPDIAADIMALPAFTKKNVHKNANNFEDVPFIIREVEGRGKGLFATRTLHRGDRIMAETPVGVYNNKAVEPDSKLDYIYLHTAFIQLPKESQDRFMKTQTMSGDPIMDRVTLNAFAGDFMGTSHFLMYPQTAVSTHYTEREEGSVLIRSR